MIKDITGRELKPGDYFVRAGATTIGLYVGRVLRPDLGDSRFMYVMHQLITGGPTQFVNLTTYKDLLIITPEQAKRIVLENGLKVRREFGLRDIKS